MNLFSKIGFAAIVIVVFGLFVQATQSPKTKENTLNMPAENGSQPPQLLRVEALNIPNHMTFAGEQVPLEDADVRERLDREIHVNTYWHSNMLLMIKKANRFFPEIELLLKKYKLPDDFKYLAVAESGLDNVKSHAGASGFWQFMKGTGKEYGLEINNYVDERYNLELATKVAAQYLVHSKELFGSWTNAAAAYNLGNAGIQKQMERQDATDYYSLLLNSETGRYVFRILAFKEVLSNPQEYGFYINEKDLYYPIPTNTVIVNTPIEDFAKFAKQHGINYKILKIMRQCL